MGIELFDAATLIGDGAGHQIAETLRLHRRAIEAATVGITISDCRLPDMPLIFANDAFMRMTGYREGDVLGRNCRFLQGADRGQAAVDALRAAVRAGRDCNVLLRNYRRDGALFWNELAMAPVRDASGSVTHYIGVQSDVTARVRAEETSQQLRVDLELRVAERTADLADANAALLAAQYETLDRLARAAESRDDLTGQHTQRVGTSSGLIARALGWPEDDARRIERAAILHDVGKIGIPDSILLKPGKLIAAEFARMQAHTTAGAAILAGSEHALLQLAELIALTHHERWDGRGYPQGLAGEAIPLAGRIVAVADVFDALTHARPYKPAWPGDRALEEVVRQAGHQFDPRVVEVFRVLYEGGALD